MWIRSQDKIRLVNVKGCYIYNTSSFKDDTQEYRVAGLISEPSVEGTHWILGVYKTKEKAMKVLDEIENRIISSESGVFQMPEDE